ncbi:hypothetical protein [Pseudomonas asplenii]|uniref:hypothetical protein n=1 Tax=Pseudomonas asplenii TaxID=53407 RepID=UPI0002D9598C|nr:hypothetical protein [Pseudomonas fuscovaginae]
MNARKLKAWQAQHATMMCQAVEATRTRQPYQPYSDEMVDYNNAQIEQGAYRFKRLLGAPFNIGPEPQFGDQVRWAGSERSPYGFDLGISYRVEDFEVLARKADKAMRKWRQLDVELRSALLCEVIARLHADTFLFAHVGMHTSGHGLFMGFHANAVHAQARALESVAGVLAVSRELTCQFEAPTGGGARRATSTVTGLRGHAHGAVTSLRWPGGTDLGRLSRVVRIPCGRLRGNCRPPWQCRAADGPDHQDDQGRLRAGGCTARYRQPVL